MSKHYDDIPCVKLNGVVHITISGTECACGREWLQRTAKAHFAKKQAVTCPDCLAAAEELAAHGEDVPFFIDEAYLLFKN